MSIFGDDGTILVFAHQDDDLLWMLPFWDEAQRFVLAGYAAPPTLRRVVAQHPPFYRERWLPLLGETSTDEEFIATYLDPVRRRDVVTEEALLARLLPIVGDPRVRRIVTHVNWGEYGHAQHRLVSRVVRRAAVELRKDVFALGAVAYASAELADEYHDVGDLDLPYVEGFCDSARFLELRALYLREHFEPASQPPRSAWTWFTSEKAFPEGTRRYVQLVTNGVDDSEACPRVAELCSLLPRIGA